MEPQWSGRDIDNRKAIARRVTPEDGIKWTQMNADKEVFLNEDPNKWSQSISNFKYRISFLICVHPRSSVVHFPIEHQDP